MNRTILAETLARRLDALIDNPPAADASAAEKAAHNSLVRSARLSLARARGSHTAAEWDAIVAETGGICVRCGYDNHRAGKQPCKGHILPMKDGGSDAADNLQPLCKTCAKAAASEQINWLEYWRTNKLPLDTEKTNA